MFASRAIAWTGEEEPSSTLERRTGTACWAGASSAGAEQCASATIPTSAKEVCSWDEARLDMASPVARTYYRGAFGGRSKKNIRSFCNIKANIVKRLARR